MEETKVKKIGRNMLYLAIFQIIKILLLFAGRIIFIQKLGASYLGISGLFTSILSILSLAELGMTTVLMYTLYKPIAEDNEEKIAAYMACFKKIYLCISLTILGLGILIMPLLKFIVNLPNNIDHIYLYYILLLINTAVSYVFIYKTTLLQADQKYYLITKYDILFQIVLFIMQLCILIYTTSYALYLVANIVCTIFSNIFKAKKAQKEYPFLNNKVESNLSKEEKKEIFKNVKSLFLYKIGTVIQTNTDNILISIFVGTIIVGYYSNYNLIIIQVTSILTLIYNSLKASVGNFMVNTISENRYQLFERLEVYNFWIVSVFSLLLYFLSSDFVGLFFGKEYILDNSLVLLIVINFYTSNIRQVIWTYRETSGIFVKTRYITLVTSFINLILSIILGKLYGIFGIILATIIARMVYAWWKEPMIIYNKLFNKSSKIYCFKYLIRFLIVAILGLIMNFAFSYIHIDNLLLLLIIKAVLTILIVGVIYLLMYYKSDAFIYLKNKIKQTYFVRK